MAKGNTGSGKFFFFQFNYQFLVLFRTKCAGVVFKEGFCGFGRRMVKQNNSNPIFEEGFFNAGDLQVGIQTLMPAW